MKKVTKAKKEKKPEFTVSIQLGNEVYSFSADSVQEALNNIKPNKITLKGIITVSNGIDSFQEFLFPAQVKRLLYGSHTVRDIFAKKSLSTLKYE